jgi:hypothetical protein
MTGPADRERQLARLFERTLRDLPLRRAPATLEARVLFELRRRASLPWWRRSFSHWPALARAGFGLGSAVLIAWIFAAGVVLIDIVQSLPVPGERWLPWGRSAAALGGVVAQLAAALARAVPLSWVYDGLAVSAALYAALFGLGIAGYRTLYRSSAPPREFGP